MLANPPTSGNGVHPWLFKVTRQLHAHMGAVEMEKLLQVRLANCGRDVPPMTKVVGRTQDGRLSEHTKDNTGPLVWLVCEFNFAKYARDGTTPTEWLFLVEGWEAVGISAADVCSALLWELAALAPLVLVVSSGGKSLHGWFRVRGSTDVQLENFIRTALRLGACSSTRRNPSQFVRMPDGVRDDGNRQLSWFFDPPASLAT